MSSSSLLRGRSQAPVSQVQVVPDQTKKPVAESLLDPAAVAQEEEENLLRQELLQKNTRLLATTLNSGASLLNTFQRPSGNQFTGASLI